MMLSQPRIWERIARRLTRLWVAASGMAVLALLLGVYGYATSLPPSVTGFARFCDALYGSITMFTINAALPPGTSGWPWPLQLARFLAAFVVFGTVIAAFWRSSIEWRTELRVGRLSNHHVIIGDGATAEHAAQAAQSPCVQLSTQDGTPAHTVAVGSDRYMVRGVQLIDGFARVAMHRAAMITVCAGADSQNRSLAFQIRDFLSDKIDGTAPRLLLESTGSDRSVLRVSQALTGLRSLMPDVRLLDLAALGARRLLTEFPPYRSRTPLEPDNAPLHVMVSEFDAFGQAVLRHLIRTCHFPDRQRLRITVVGRISDHTRENFISDYPALDLVADVRWRNKAATTVRTAEWDAWQQDGAFDAVYVTGEDINSACLHAIDAVNGLGDSPAPGVTVICAHGITALRLNEQFPGVSVFDTAGPDVLKTAYSDPIEDEARSGHEAYFAERRQAASSLSLEVRHTANQTWEDLPEWLRDKNRDQITYRKIFAWVLAALGRTPADVNTDPALLEILAEVEHRRWMSSTVLAGFRHGSVRDEERKLLHEWLIPYADLPDVQKANDRRNVLRAAKALTEAS